jgi:hypothetical protein
MQTAGHVIVAVLLDMVMLSDGWQRMSSFRAATTKTAKPKTTEVR